ncbi:MAG TPA: nitroreductase family protein [Spirochaetota bacterium]|nr:nitroreductase family protein [Spirochaetota bacterium]
MLEIIKSRRSVRSYENKSISKDDLKELLEAGMYAPSAGNEQAWQFIVLEGEVLKKYLELNKNVPQSAPFGILVCMDWSQEKYKGMNMPFVDCAAATQNILLLAHSKGLGAIWTAIFENVKSEVKKLLNLPEHIEPFSFIPVGYSKENNRETPKRYDEKKIHYNKW